MTPNSTCGSPIDKLSDDQLARFFASIADLAIETGDKSLAQHFLEIAYDLHDSSADSAVFLEIAAE